MFKLTSNFDSSLLLSNVQSQPHHLYMIWQFFSQHHGWNLNKSAIQNEVPEVFKTHTTLNPSSAIFLKEVITFSKIGWADPRGEVIWLCLYI